MRVPLWIAASALGALLLLGAIAFALLGRDASPDDTPPGNPAVRATPLPAAAATPVPTPKETPVPSLPALDAYSGLGSWVDIYDDEAWRNPSRAVSDMASHGVRTLFIETANSRAPSAIKDPVALRTFMSEAHARDMRVVAWYLPSLKSEAKDFSRIAEAIAFRTADGRGFDSFALDIESSAVRPESERNTRLAALSAKIRALVGPSYPLGAIIPSPVGLAKKAGYWDDFPYAEVAQAYDILVPMGYYTYHGDGARSAYEDTRANVRILRAQKGCVDKPIHLIGGLAEKSSAAEVEAFVRAARETGCFGASLYGWVGTSDGHWRALQSVETRPAARVPAPGGD